MANSNGFVVLRSQLQIWGRKKTEALLILLGAALPSHVTAPDGCVLKVDPSTASVSTFITDPIPNGAETGWLYHGGSLAGGYVYAIPASASRVMKIGESKRMQCISSNVFGISPSILPLIPYLRSL